MQCLPTINRLSEHFQKTELDFSLVNTALKGTISSLKEKKEMDMTENVTSVIDKLKTADVTVNLGKKTLHENVIAFEESTKKPFIDQLIMNLEARFTHTDVMAAFIILFNPATYKKSDPLSDLKSSVKVLTRQFGVLPAPGLPTPEEEVGDFLHYVRSADDVSEYMSKLQTGKLTSFPTLCTLAHIYMVQPPPHCRLRTRFFANGPYQNFPQKPHGTGYLR